MGTFFKSDAGRKVFDVQKNNLAAVQNFQMQWLMTATTSVNEAVRAELTKRGIKP